MTFFLDFLHADIEIESLRVTLPKEIVFSKLRVTHSKVAKLAAITLTPWTQVIFNRRLRTEHHRRQVQNRLS